MEVCMEWLMQNGANVVAILWTVDQLLKIIAKMTPTKIDDNISDYLGSILSKFFPKKDA